MSLLKNAIRNELAKETSSITGEDKGQVLDRWNKEDLQKSIEQGNQQAERRRADEELANSPEMQRIQAKKEENRVKRAKLEEEKKMAKAIWSMQDAEKLVPKLEKMSAQEFKEWKMADEKEKLEKHKKEKYEHEVSERNKHHKWTFYSGIITFSLLALLYALWPLSWDLALSLLVVTCFPGLFLSAGIYSFPSQMRDYRNALKVLKAHEKEIARLSNASDSDLTTELKSQISRSRKHIKYVRDKYKIDEFEAKEAERQEYREQAAALQASVDADTKIAVLEAKLAQKEKDKRIAELEAKLAEAEGQAPKKESEPLFGSLLSGEGQPVKDKENG